MRKLHAVTVVACEDIRREYSGRAILIGVYATILWIPSLPRDVQISWWLLSKPEIFGEIEVEVRVVGPNDSILHQETLHLEIEEISKGGIIRINRMPLQLQAEGQIALQWDAGEKDWETLKELEVKIRPPKEGDGDTALSAPSA